MKRAILVTTGTVVGVASVIAYKPTIDSVSMIPGAEALTASSTLNATALPTSDATTPSSTASATAAPTTDATAPAATGASPSASASTNPSAGASKAPSATPSASAKSSTAASAPTQTPTATPAPSKTASSSGSSSSSSSTLGNIDFSKVPDGTYTGSTQNVESHGRFYGTANATVTVSGGKMTSISFNQTPVGRNERFISAVQSVLVPEMIRSQNIAPGIVSGATGTSLAVIYSLNDVLTKAMQN